jgi:DnaJ-class molecular chaperone
MSRQLDGGKGSARRKEDSQAVRDNWDRIFGAKAPESSPTAAGKTKEQTMIDDDDNEDYTDEIDEYDYCRVCSGSGEGMYDGSSCHACGGTGNATVDKEDDCYDDYE